LSRVLFVLSRSHVADAERRPPPRRSRRLTGRGSSPGLGRAALTETARVAGLRGSHRCPQTECIEQHLTHECAPMPRQNASARQNRCSALSDSQMAIASIDIPIRRSGRAWVGDRITLSGLCRSAPGARDPPFGTACRRNNGSCVASRTDDLGHADAADAGVTAEDLSCAFMAFRARSPVLVVCHDW